MTPDQIIQLRTKLKRMLTPQCSASESLELAKEALALLPCPTCNGTGIMPESKSYLDGLTIGRGGKPCLDCQQHSS